MVMKTAMKAAEINGRYTVEGRWFSDILRNVPEIFIGLETANAFAKGFNHLSGNNADVFRTVLERANKKAYDECQARDLNLRIKKNGFDNVEEVYYVDHLDSYFRVGALPTTQDNHYLLTNTNESKYFEPNYLACFLIGVYRQIRYIPGFEKADVYCVTGLPTFLAEDVAFVEKFKDFYTREWAINGQAFNLVVDVESEGTAIYYNDFYDNRGEMNDEFFKEFKDKKEGETTEILYGDIGHLTIDFRRVSRFTVVEGHQLPGMSTVWEKLKNIAVGEDKNGQKCTLPGVVSNPKLQQFNVLALEEDLRNGGKINISHQRADVPTSYIEEVYEEKANEIVRFITEDKFKNIAFDQIRIGGGGSIALRKAIKKCVEKHFEGNQSIIDSFIFLDEPQTANAKGYLKVCKQYYCD